MKKKPTKVQLLRAELRRLLRESEPYELIIKERQPTLAEAAEMDRIADAINAAAKKLELAQRGSK